MMNKHMNCNCSLCLEAQKERVRNMAMVPRVCPSCNKIIEIHSCCSTECLQAFIERLKKELI